MLIYANLWVFNKMSKVKHFDQLVPQLLLIFWSSHSLMCALKWQKNRFSNVAAESTLKNVFFVILTVVTLSHRIKKWPLKYSHLFCRFWRIYEFFSKFQKYKSRIISMQYFWEYFDDQKDESGPSNRTKHVLFFFKPFSAREKGLEKTCFFRF